MSKKQIRLLRLLSQHSQGLTLFEINDHVNPHIRKKQLTYTKLVKEGLIEMKWGKHGVGTYFVLSAKGFDTLKAREEHLEEKKHSA